MSFVSLQQSTERGYLEKNCDSQTGKITAAQNIQIKSKQFVQG